MSVYIASILVGKQDRQNARICLKFGRVCPQIAELAAFECQNLYEENENGQHSGSFIFVLIGSSSFFAGNMDNHKISDEFEIRPNPTIDCCP